MFKKVLFLLIIFILSLVAISARELYIDYLDGYLDIKVGNNWEPVDIGDELSDTATIRLSENGYVELLSGITKITLDNDGIYEVGSLLDHVTTASKWGIKGSSFAKLLHNDELEAKQSAVMGVRGDPQDEEEITWVDDDIEFLEEGKSFYQSKNYHNALAILEEGAEWYGSNYDEILFYKALCEYEIGDLKQMRNSLFEMDPDPAIEFFGDYVLLKGNILIESQNYNEAEDLFDLYLSESEYLDKEQLVYLLSAFCSINLNDRGNAERKLRKAIGIDPNSETGRRSRQILESL